MIYKTLFNLSNLSNGEICRRLDIGHTARIQYEKATKFKIEQYVDFGKKLGLTDAQLTELVVERINELLKKS